MLPQFRRAFIAVACVLLAGCSGGTGSNSAPVLAPVVAASPASAISTTTATLTLQRTLPDDARARVKYIPASATSATITFVQGATTIPNTVSLAGCNPSCTVSVNAPIGGGVTVVVTLFAGTQPVAGGTATGQTIAPTGTSLTLAIGAIVKSVSLYIPRNAVFVGASQQYTVTPTLRDAANATIPANTPLANPVNVAGVSNVQFGSCGSPQSTLTFSTAPSTFTVCGQIAGAGSGTFSVTPSAYPNTTPFSTTGTVLAVPNHHIYLSGGTSTIACDAVNACASSGANTGLNGNYSGASGNFPLTYLSSGGTPTTGMGAIGVAGALLAGAANTAFNGSSATVIGGQYSYFNFNGCVRQAAFDCFGVANDGSGIIEYNATSTIRTGTTQSNGATGVAAWVDGSANTYALYPDNMSGQYALVQFSNGTTTIGALQSAAIVYDRPAGMSVGLNRNIAVSYANSVAYVGRTDGYVDVYALPLIAGASPLASYNLAPSDKVTSLYVDDANQTLFVGMLSGKLFGYVLSGQTVRALRSSTQFVPGAVNYLAEDPTGAFLYASYGGSTGGPTYVAQVNRNSFVGTTTFITGTTHYGIVTGP